MERKSVSIIKKNKWFFIFIKEGGVYMKYEIGNILLLKDGRTAYVYAVSGDKCLVIDCDDDKGKTFYIKEKDVYMKF